MKLLISSFYTITQEVEDLINKWEKDKEEYTLVMTDSASPFITDIRRGDFLTKTLLKKDFPIEHLATNESDLESFTESLNKVVKDFNENNDSVEVFFQTNFGLDDFTEDHRKNLKFDFTELDSPKGDLLANVGSYIHNSSNNWKNRCGRTFKDIVQLNMTHEMFDSYLVVPFFKNKEGDVVFMMGLDLVTDEAVILDTYTDDIEMVPIFTTTFAKQLDSKVIDWHIRVFVENGVSHSVIFLELEDSDTLYEMKEGNDLVLLDDDIVATFGVKGDFRSSDLHRAWIGEKLYDIEDMEENSLEESSQTLQVH